MFVFINSPSPKSIILFLLNVNESSHGLNFVPPWTSRNRVFFFRNSNVNPIHEFDTVKHKMRYLSMFSLNGTSSISVDWRFLGGVDHRPVPPRQGGDLLTC